MNLEAMTLPDLQGLSADLGMLIKVGRLLESAGLAPRFDMRPGRPVVIHTGWTMFPAESPASGSGLSGETGFPAPLPVAAPEPATLYVDDPQPVAVATVAPDVAPAPAGSAVPGGAGADWTEEEDAALVEALARNRVSGGATQNDVLRECAKTLGRTDRSVEQRFQRRLRYRVESRVAELDRQGAAAPQPDQPAPAEPDSNTNSPAGPEEGTSPPTVPAGETTGAAPPPAAPVVRDDDEQNIANFFSAEAWLRTVKRDAVWTLQTDHDVMHLSVLGWSAGDIALECNVPAAEVKPRFELLTNKRTISRATVLDALARILASA